MTDTTDVNKTSYCESESEDELKVYCLACLTESPKEYIIINEYEILCKTCDAEWLAQAEACPSAR